MVKIHDIQQIQHPAVLAQRGAVALRLQPDRAGAIRRLVQKRVARAGGKDHPARDDAGALEHGARRRESDGRERAGHAGQLALGIGEHPAAVDAGILPVGRKLHQLVRLLLENIGLGALDRDDDLHMPPPLHNSAILLSYTVLSDKSLKSWNTTPILLLKYGTLLCFKNVVSLPFIIIFPLVGSSSFNINLINVDFPLPELPTKNANSPFSILKLAFFTASVPVLYLLQTFLNSIIFLSLSKFYSLLS